MMATLQQRLAGMSRERLALLAHDLQDRLRRQDEASREAIAIVGAACRFPKAPDLESYWSLLSEGREAVSEIPPERWDVDRYYSPDPNTPGTMYTKSGSFIDSPTRFDSAFFAISSREALAMDPQQRLLLETSWHALEDALIPPASLQGSRTGVFIGISTTDYLQLGCQTFDLIDMDAYVGTGCAASVAAGRLSYVLGLQGPCLPVDTACSSSLVAVHLACRSLRTGESDLALAGGVNLMLLQDTFVYFSRLRALSPDGRCKTFDASADGYGRGEGCGVVVLKRLSDALADRDDIMAVVLGSDVNHDGRSNGLTVPSGKAQEEVVRAALKSAALPPESIGYVEAHGTGTPLGDPIELHALGSVHKKRPTPLLVGSAKTNIGHLEAAAGIAGLLKLALMLKHRTLAPHLNFRQPNPYVDWANLPIEVASTSREFPEIAGCRTGGVSSFGFGGTNAHVILQGYDRSEEGAAAGPPDRPEHILCLSAKTESALKSLVAEMIERPQDPALEFGDICWSANAGRTHFEQRLALQARDHEAARGALGQWLEGSPSSAASARARPRARPAIAFLFSGQGSQYPGMGRGLYEAEPVFRAAIDECATLLGDTLGSPLPDLLWGADATRLDGTDCTQPALFALEVALGRLWLSRGVVPELAIGHSVGEYASAHLAGLFALEDGIRIIAARGRLMTQLCRPGSMLALDCDLATAERLIESHRDEVAVAAVNGPRSIVLSGDPERIRAIETGLAGIRHRALAVSHGFHSPLMTPMLEAFGEVLATVKFHRPQWRLISNLTGKQAENRELMQPAYWVRHVQQPVMFEESVRTALALGADTFIEIGPRPVLLGMAQAIGGSAGRWLPSLQPPAAEHSRFLESVKSLYLAGAPIDWRSADAPFARRRARLPAYPFEGKNFWPETKRRGDPPAARPRADPVDDAPEAEAKPDPTDRLFGIDWVDWAGGTAVDRAAAGPVLVFADEGGVGDAVAARLAADGREVLLVRAGESAALEEGRLVVRPTEPADYEALLQRAGGPVSAILHLWSLDWSGGDPLAAQDRGYRSALLLLQALLARGERSTARIGFVTRGAQTVVAGEAVPGFAAATLGGLVRVALIENPFLSFMAIDLAAEGDEGEADFITQALTDEHRETFLARRAGKALVARLTRRRDLGPPSALDADGCWLITGGLGGIGLYVADWLVGSGVRRLALVGRGPPGEEAAVAIEALSARGAKVLVLAGDVTDETRCAALVEEVRATLGPITAIAHAAGAMDNDVLPKLDWDRCEAVLAPKLAGAWNLDRATEGDALTHFLLFSSVSSVLGSPGHGAYAPANAALDAFAGYRRGRGLPALAVNWGAWAATGLAARLTGEVRARWDSLGIGSLEPSEALDALSAIIGAAEPQIAVLATDWSRFFDSFPLGLEPPLLVTLAAESNRIHPPSAEWQALMARAAGAAPELRRMIIGDWIEQQLAAVLGAESGEALDRTAGFFDLGVDSLMSLEFRARLQQNAGTALALPTTLAFDYPSVDALAAYVERRALSAGQQQPAPSARPAARVAAAESAEAIAIVGIGCRFPGSADSPEAFWENLESGLDAIGVVPEMRWDADAYYDPDPDAPGKMNTRFGGFVDGIEWFDAAFFGVSPREASRLDPQQRMLLETSWRALEDAGVPAARLAEAAAGVFVGVSINDYPQVLARGGDIGQIDAYLGVGNALSMVAGRLAHFLGLRGPALSVDTACSSSLVAIHLACASLRRGECEVALAGGVNAILIPEVNIGLSKARMLAPDGRCKTFEAAADGYVRSEGCGVVLLKRLSAAQRDGDRIVAVIRASAVNHDGRSGGLTVPNAEAQQALLGDCLAAAGLAPADVQYVETHGTGTPLGDPIEVQALARAYGAGRDPAEPLLIGAVKTNIGHLESAAGIAGVIKTALALRHGAIPATLHQHRPNPHVPWPEIPIRVVKEHTAWPDAAVRRAGVSSFGFSGTNAHLILEAAPVAGEAAAAPPLPPGHILTVSARTRPALDTLAGQVETQLRATPEAEVADLCRALNVGRSAMAHRLAVRGDSPAALADALVAARAAEDSRARRGRVAFLFSGQGSQRVGMGRRLFEAEPRFRDAILACEAAMAGTLEAPLTDILWSGEAERLDRTENTQPALFALEYALASLWLEWGVRPQLMVGHSIGEIAAACIAGVFDLADACRLVVARGALMRDLCPPGAMLALSCDEARARTLIEGLEDRLSVAALNGPANTVLSGEPEAIQAAAAKAAAASVTAQPLAVSRAFHSQLMEPMLAAFAEVAGSISYRPPEITIVSSVTGAPAGADIATAGYWVRQVREPVAFAAALRAAADMGANSFVEIGPRPVATAMAMQVLDAPDHLWLPSLRREGDDWTTMLDALARLFRDGVAIDWQAFHAPWPHRHVAVPAYPFERQRFWPDVAPARPVSLAAAPELASAPAAAGHPFLGEMVRTPAFKGVIHEATFAAERPGFLDDHRIYSMVAVPGAGHMAMVFAAFERLRPGAAIAIRDVTFEEVLVIPDGETRLVQLVLTPVAADAYGFEIYSRAGETDVWLLHAAGSVAALDDVAAAEPGGLDGARERCPEAFGQGALFYQFMSRQGINLGPQLRWIERVWRTEGEALGELRPASEADEPDDYLIHPGLLDSCFQLMGATLDSKALEQGAYIPISIEQLRLHRPPRGRLFNHVVARPQAGEGDERRIADLVVYDESGAVVAEVDGLRIHRAPRAGLMRFAQRHLREAVWGVNWVAASPPETRSTPPGCWLLFADESGFCDALAGPLAEAGARIVTVPPAAGTGEPDWFDRPLRDAIAEAGDVGIVFGWTLSSGPADADDVDAALETGAFALMRLAQAIGRKPGAVSRLAILTRGQQATGAEPPDLTHAAVPALARVLGNEFPQTACATIDLDEAGEAAVAAVHRELLALEPGAETDIAYRDGARLVRRLGRSLAGRRKSGAGFAANEPYQLVRPESGVFEDLELAPSVRDPLGAQDVEILVGATGLNFRDVLNVLGLYPGDAGPLGGECSGTVVGVGAEVTAFAPGDRVAAIGAGTFSRYAVTDHRMVLKLPDEVALARAATVPVAFVTAWLALVDMADVKAGESVLIHAGAGGVGLAAIQIAHHLGAVVHATAGSDAKRDFLRALGVGHVYDSRSLDFAAGVAEETAGRGVDVVLNSLAGEFIAHSVQVTAENGRFVEIGKNQIWTPQRMAGERPDIGYHVMALDEVIIHRPEEVGRILHLVGGLIEADALAPLPGEEFPVAAAADAFRFLAQARNIGKVVVLHGEEAAAEEALVDPDASYVVTGGLGSLGLATARWLAERGARNLLLLGRSAPSEAAAAAIAEIEALGASVLIRQGDVTAAGDVAALLDAARAAGTRLGGVFHAAGALDDTPLMLLDEERFRAVLDVKLKGALHLDALTRDDRLDHFVLFSSAAALFGTPGQGNYAAANGFLDALAARRRAQGLPALSVNWGPWADAGMAAVTAQAVQRMWAAMGIASIRPRDGFATMEMLLRDGAPNAVVLSADWARLAAWFPSGVHRLLENLAAEAGQASGPPPEWLAFVEELRQTPPAARKAMLVERFRNHSARVLGLESGDEIDPRTPLNELGLDSLMAVELANQLSAASGVRLRVTQLFDYPTIDALAGFYLDEVLSFEEDEEEEEEEEEEEAAPGLADDADCLIESVFEISDEEVERRLLDAEAGK